MVIEVDLILSVLQQICGLVGAVALAPSGAGLNGLVGRVSSSRAGPKRTRSIGIAHGQLPVRPVSTGFALNRSIHRGTSTNWPRRMAISTSRNIASGSDPEVMPAGRDFCCWGATGRNLDGSEFPFGAEEASAASTARAGHMASQRSLGYDRTKPERNGFSERSARSALVSITLKQMGRLPCGTHPSFQDFPTLKWPAVTSVSRP